ncbi:MAG: glycosyltransferase family 39 protein [Desulfuromonadales bacterium]|nr:glycosyltransferase family 39 protein [Desulfuromonadales bacterium]
MIHALKYLKDHWELVVLAAILALSVLLRLAFLHEPFDRDEGHYAAIAQEILRGGLPYRDAIEIKPPGVFYLHALGIVLFSATVEGIRIFTALYALGTVLAVYLVARRVAGVTAGLWAAAIFAVFSSFPLMEGSSSNSEVFLILPLTLGAWFMLGAIETNKRSSLCWCGLCAGLAMLIKPVALPFVALEFLVIPFTRSGKNRLKETLIDLAAFLVPMAILALATIGYFALRGGLDQFLYWTVVFPNKYKGMQLSRATLPMMISMLAPLLIPFALALFSLPWLLKEKRNLSGLFMFLLIPAAWCAVALPGKYFPHYFINLVPFISALAGIALAYLASLRRPVAWITLLLFAVCFGMILLKNYKLYTVYSPEEISITKHGPIFVNVAKTARFLKERTGTDDYIFQWGLEPELYFLADRRSPTPFLGSVLVGWSRDPEAAKNELTSALFAKRPKYIVFQPEWSKQPGINEVMLVISSWYVFDRQLPFGYIVRRRDVPFR